MSDIQYGYLGIILLIMMAMQDLHNHVVQERLNVHYKHIDALWDQNDENREALNKIIEKLNDK